MQPSAVDSIAAELLHRSIHDLNGPANRIRVLVQLLERNAPGLDDESRKLLRYIEESAAAVRTVADGLKRYAVICARPLQRQPVDLNDALDAAILRAPGDVRFTRTVLPVVDADAFLIAWVFDELFANALRARPPEGELHIHICAGRGGPGGSYIAVVDNGTGIAEGMTERIFRPFDKQIPSEGPGMGLTICRTIIERHGGRMWAEDRAEGAEFRFFLPA